MKQDTLTLVETPKGKNPLGEVAAAMVSKRNPQAAMAELAEYPIADIPLQNIRLGDTTRLLRKTEKGETKPKADIIALANNIKANGFLPTCAVIVQQESNGTYTVLAGNRRSYASYIAGLEAIPAVILPQDASADTVRKVQEITNIQRPRGNDGAELVASIERMLADKRRLVSVRVNGKTVPVGKRLAVLYGLPPSEVSRRLKLAKYKSVFWPPLREGKIRKSVCLKIIKACGEDKAAMLKAVDQYLKDGTLPTSKEEAEKEEIRTACLEAVYAQLHINASSKAKAHIKALITQAFDVGVAFAYNPKDALANFDEGVSDPETQSLEDLPK